MVFDQDVNSMYAGIYAPYIPKMTIKLSEARIHGARYYTVEPIFANWGELETWAFDTYGKPSSVWDLELGRWYLNDRRFWFKEQSDVTAFVLRWQ